MILSTTASLQRRLLLGVLGGVVGVWLLTAALTWRDARHELDELLDAHLAQAAAVLVVQQLHELAEEEQHDDGLPAPSLHRYAPRAAFQVWHEGRLVVRSEVAPETPMVRLDRPHGDGFETVSIAGVPWRVFATRGAERDLQVFVGEQLDVRRAILRAVLRSVLWPTLIALPVLAALLWWGVRQGLRPLRSLRDQLARRAPEALLELPTVGAPAELRPMIETLNGLFERIGALLARERRFTADAAHELRTPLAALRAQAQVALGSKSAGEQRHALQGVLQGCDRLARLIEQLLQLARLDGSAQRHAVGTVPLASLVRQVAAELAPQAVARRQELSLEAGAEHAVPGDEVLAGVLVRNLLDNALRYSPDGAQVRVAVQPMRSHVCLTVEDSGPGMSEPDLARLGERFFRVTGSDGDGSGLGWSIVRRIAELLGATLKMDRSPALGGLRVRVHWPLVGGAA